MSQTTPAPHESGYVRPAVAWYLVLVLMLVYVVSFVDRQAMSILVTPIRTALHIDDFHAGFLMGPGFALFYTFFGIPLGWVADKYNRVGLIVFGLVFWSLMTSGCGMANQFSALLLFRFGVGIGEATLSPAAYSMIADSFPPRRLAFAISLYSMGLYIGSGLANVIVGQVVAYTTAHGVPSLPMVGPLAAWQFVFIFIGLAGLPLVLLLFTVREPARHKSSVGVSFGQTFAYIGKHKAAFLLHSAGFGLLALVGYASTNWIPVFFERIHGWPVSETAKTYGVIVLVLGPLGILSGGLLADALRARGYVDGSMRTCALSAVVALVFMATYPLVATPQLSMACIAGLTYSTSLASGAAPTAIQQMMPPAMRGQASAVYLFIVNIIGIAIGPLAVGFCNSHLFGDTGIHHSLLLVGCVGCVGALCLLLLGLAPFRRAADEVEAIVSQAAGI